MSSLLEKVDSGDQAALESIPSALADETIDLDTKLALLQACFSLAKVENFSAVGVIRDIICHPLISFAHKSSATHCLVLCVKKGHEQALEEAGKCLFEIAKQDVLPSDVVDKKTGGQELLLATGSNEELSISLVKAVAEAAKKGMERAVKILEEQWDHLSKTSSLCALEGLSAAAGRGNTSAVLFLADVWMHGVKVPSESNDNEENSNNSAKSERENETTKKRPAEQEAEGGASRTISGSRSPPSQLQQQLSFPTSPSSSIAQPPPLLSPSSTTTTTPTPSSVDPDIFRVSGEGLMLAAQRGHEQAISFLLSVANNPSLPSSFRRSALSGVAGAASRRGHKGAIEMLHKCLGEGGGLHEIAATAFEAAAHEGHEHAIDLLTSELDRPDGHHDVAAGALAVAAREGFEIAIAALACRAANLGDDARLIAVRGLAGAAAGTDEGGSERAVDVLFGLLGDPHEDVQLVVYDGLAAAVGRGHEPATKVLVAQFDTLSDLSRAAAIRGLATAGENGNEYVVETLFKAMDDPCEDVRVAAHDGMQACVARNSEVAIRLILAASNVEIPETIEEEEPTSVEA